MSVAPGGKIKQVIHADLSGPNSPEGKWLPSRTTVFNVQVLNARLYAVVTGKSPPGRPLDVRTYKKHGFPFFYFQEEPTGISGSANFSAIKSVAEIDGVEEEEVVLAVVPTGGGNHRHAVKQSPEPVGIVNPAGPMLPFRTVRTLKQEYAGRNYADF
jgi:hypothetical protein